VPVPPHSRVRSAPDALSNLAIEVLSLCRLHRDVTREGAQQCDVFLGCVSRLPDVATDPDIFEEAAVLELGRLVRNLLRQARRPVSFVAFADRVIDLLDLAEEGIETVR